MNRTVLKNVNAPDAWIDELPAPSTTNGTLVTGWNSVPLFFNLPEVSQRRNNYKDITEQVIKEYLFLDGLGPETTSDFIANYWNSISHGNFSFGIKHATNADGTPVIPDLDFNETAVPLDPDDWNGIVMLHLSKSGEEVWKAAGELTAPNGRRWIPSVFLVDTNRNDAFANGGHRNFTLNEIDYVVGDAYVIGFGYDLFDANGNLTPEGTSKNYWGTLAHEYAHNILEKNDFYGPSGAILYWDLLGNDEDPSRMSEVFSIFKAVTGWITFKEEIQGPSIETRTVELIPYTTSGEAIRVTPDPVHTPHEYFLLEYRKSTGNETWRPDGGLTEEGLLITHVNALFSINHNPWNRREAPSLDIEQADFTDQGTTKRLFFADTNGNLYPQPGNNQFTPSSSPNSNLYGDRSSGLSITDIKLEADKLTFNLTIQNNSEIGWNFSPSARYISGRFSEEAQSQGAEIIAWDALNYGLLKERQGVFVCDFNAPFDAGEYVRHERRQLLAGDFDGDGLDEIFVRGNSYTSILKRDGLSFNPILPSTSFWDPSPKDRDYVVRLKRTRQQQLLTHRENRLTLREFNGNQILTLLEVEGTIGNVRINTSLKVIPINLRNLATQDLFLSDGQNAAVVAYDEAGNAWEVVYESADFIGNSLPISLADNYVASDLDGDGLMELYVHNATLIGVLKWVNNTLSVLYIQSSWIIHNNLSNASRQPLTDKDKAVAARFRPDRMGIYHIAADRVLQLLWDDNQQALQIQRHVQNGWEIEFQMDDQFIPGDYHRLGTDPNIGPAVFSDFQADNFTDLFVVNKDRAQLVASNYLVASNGAIRDEFATTWKAEQGIVLQNPGSINKSVIAASEDRKGRNHAFTDVQSGKSFSREEFVQLIEAGRFPEYHIRVINGIKTPVSNPNHKLTDNLDR